MQARYDKRKAACEKVKTRATTRCEKASRRCAKVCGQGSKAKARPRRPKKG